MISQSIVAVVLPAGRGPGGTLRANVYLAPRLSGAQRLSQFPDWLDWTALVRQHGLRFTLASGTRSATVAADITGLRPDVWTAIFKQDSLVDEYSAPDFTQRLIVSYPSRQVHDLVRFAYQSAAGAADSTQAGRLFNDVLGELSFRNEDGTSSLDQELSEFRVRLWSAQHPIQIRAAGGGAQPAAAQQPPVPPPEVHALATQFALYHRLPPGGPNAKLPGTAAELAKLIDFHQALTGLAAHPSLLTATGLVLPVELPGSLCPDSPAASAYLAVQVTAIEPGWTWAHEPAVGAPATAYLRDSSVFTCAPATTPAALAAGNIEPGDIIDGFLALAETDFEVVGVDLDGALLQALALADNLANDPTTADGLLAALRSSGLSLLADNRAQQVLQAIQDNQAFGAALSGQTVRPLTARDVTRGFRMDIFSDGTQAWHSLHRRDGRYVLDGGGVVLAVTDEEGFTQLAVVQPADNPPAGGSGGHGRGDTAARHRPLRQRASGSLERVVAVGLAPGHSAEPQSGPGARA